MLENNVPEYRTQNSAKAVTDNDNEHDPASQSDVFANRENSHVLQYD